MSLTKYKQKRSFDKTPEPKGGRSNAGLLHFVIQKHNASRLHYDFRLEMDGVLKSWAVPKGPSLDPSVKRLAMMVEDHPYDYKNFEGIIPKGNYGAGTVIVWDEGTYTPIDNASEKAAQEQSLLKQLKAGSLKFALNGKKLKGEFALVKTHGMAENAWLLIKHKDKYASEKDITKKDKSVISGKGIDKMATAPDHIYGANPKKKNPAPKKAVRAKARATKTKEEKTENRLEQKTASGRGDDDAGCSTDEIDNLLKTAPRTAFPGKMPPMLATLVDAPFDDDDWVFEIKWDGYRTIAFINNGEVSLRSRNDKSFDDKFYPVYDAVKKWRVKAVVDGEIVVINDKGISRFNALQNWRSEADGQLLYYVFDILWYNGKMLTGLPLKDRSPLLASIVPKEESSVIRAGFSIRGEGKKFFTSAEQLGLEGIIAKRLNSVYVPGDRSRDWLKIKVHKRQEVIIIGYTRNEGSPKLFSSLLLGVYDNGNLEYAGKVGTGFNDKSQKQMMAQFKPLVTSKPPVKEIPDYNKPSRFRHNPPHAAATWLKPELVCEVSFSEVTEDGVFRHPSFQGMREDKKAKDVIREKEKPVTIVIKETEKNLPARQKKNAAQSAPGPLVKPPVKGSRKTLLNPADKTQARKINNIELQFTNLNKVFWPETGISKRDLCNYYYQVAPYILPYLVNRPQSLYRFPDGYKGKSFYQKDVRGKVPDWVETLPYTSDPDKEFMVPVNEAGLLYMANFGCIEMNPWSSTVKRPDNPDWCILDLDPGVKSSFEQVIEAARVIHQLLEGAGIPSFPKTSGATGMHIYIPLHAKYSYEQSKEFARLIVTIVQEQIPDYTSIERQVSDRNGKMYLDFLQNRPQATLAAPYSVRPKPGATVSMPLHWEEVKKGLKMQDFTLPDVPAMLDERGDIFKGVLGKGIDMRKALKKLQTMM